MMSTSSSPPEPTERKTGAATPNELKNFVVNAGSRLLVVDVRHPDASVEPGDAKSLAVAGFPNKFINYRNMAINLPWNRETMSMELPTGIADYDTPIITHCGGGGRGQKAKEYLIKNGYTNVMNGGGPKETECWAEYGLK
jgi:rhodanese-related sulfurtransferase